ncbi:hypothetical protein [Allorhodopirellula solitaria]|uniref:Uncharacterized protein n=1 Tax=Allorhodopirellula solitaria TaxID=2527987 RepID=A0A5C5YCP4_9BACT|nr:hypothetical protein [Allorhodopirellula solitaria]TWT73150.1 hypothetical protein CA85_16170 [Allorhodopirellula solitaria]
MGAHHVADNVSTLANPVVYPARYFSTDEAFTMKSAKIEMQFLGFFIAWIAVSTGVGCTLWNSGVWSDTELLAGINESSDEAKATTHTTHHNVSSLTHQSRDTISLAVEFRHVPSSVLGETMWRSIDETVFETGVRQAWLANGLRVGVLHDVNPPSDNGSQGKGKPLSDPINELFAGAKVLGGQADGREIIPLRPTRRHELPLAPALSGNTTVLLQDTGGLIGKAVESPQFLLAITAQKGTRQGQALLHLRPEIQHGAVRQKFISSDAAVRIQAGRERWELSDLNLAWTAQPGATLVIAPVAQPSESEPTFGLGRQMLRDSDHLVDDQHIVAFLQVEKP